MNAYRAAANAVFWLHHTWVLLLLAGLFVQFAFPWYGPVEVVLLTFTLVAQARSGKCPLTILENALRARCDPGKTYEGSFLRHYARKHLKVDIPAGMISAVLKAMLALSVIVWVFTYPK